MLFLAQALFLPGSLTFFDEIPGAHLFFSPIDPIE